MYLNVNDCCRNFNLKQYSLIIINFPWNRLEARLRIYGDNEMVNVNRNGNWSTYYSKTNDGFVNIGSVNKDPPTCTTGIHELLQCATDASLMVLLLCAPYLLRSTPLHILPLPMQLVT